MRMHYYSSPKNVNQLWIKKQSCAAMLTGLFKAFDYLPHQLLIAIFHAYGMDKSAYELMCSYFFQRLQRIKIGHARSEWKHVTQGKAQGTTIVACNVLINDLLLSNLLS